MSTYNRNIHFDIIGEDNAAAIADNAMRVLEEVGCEVLNARAREVLAAGGCRIENTMCYIPRAVVESAIAKTPKSVAFFSRDGEEAFTIDPDCFHYGPHLGCPRTMDVETGRIRDYVRADVANFARVSNALPNMDWAAAVGQINDVDPRVSQVYEAHDMLVNTRKPFTTWVADGAMLDEVVEMCTAVAGSLESFVEKPFMYIGMCPNNCLAHGDAELEPFIRAAEIGIPLLYTPGYMLGVQGPITLAGMGSVVLADGLFGLVLAQLVNPGMPFISAAWIDDSDLTTLGLAMTGPESPKGTMMMASVFRHLGLPFASHAGTTDKPCVDVQAGADAAITLYSAMMAGSGLTVHAGYVAGGMVSSLEFMVVQDEIVGELRRFERGIDVDEETLDFDEIAEMGPKGNYLEADMTAMNMRSLWQPTVFSRAGEEKWEATGSLTCYQIANERVKEILAQGNQNPLPDEVVAKLDEILDRSVKRILG